MANYSRILAWRISWIEEPCRVHGVAKSQIKLSDLAHTHTDTCMLSANMEYTHTHVHIHSIIPRYTYIKTPMHTVYICLCWHTTYIHFWSIVNYRQVFLCLELLICLFHRPRHTLNSYKGHSVNIC